MCGIVACRTDQSATDHLLLALRRLEYRGYDSVGIAVNTADGSIERFRTVRRIDTLDRIVRRRPGATPDDVGIGHTRWATHGKVSEDNAHPHIDCSGRIALVHNGIIQNAESLRAELIGAGHVLATSVDSEVLCHLIEDESTRRENLLDAVRIALKRAEGSWALAVLERGTGRIVVAAHGSPLLIAHTEQGYFAASDISAIADWVDEFRVLEDGDVVDLTDTDFWLGQDTGRRPSPRTRCPGSFRDIELNGYPDFMAKEIDEQPAAAMRLLDELGDTVATGSYWGDRDLPAFDRLQVIGCGTSLNAGRVIGNAVRRIGGLPVTCVVASEAADEVPEGSTLRLAVSQSGETADVLAAIGSPSWFDLPLLALTNSSHSTLARQSNAIVLCEAGPEIGVAATKTFVCQVIAGVAAMISAMVVMKRLTPVEAAGLVDDLKRVPDRLADAVAAAKSMIPPLVADVAGAGGFVFIARGLGLPYAAEGALKLKELTYRWAEHYPAGELKHGPLALITEGTPVVVVDSGDAKLACNVAEVRARGGRVIAVPSLCDGEFHHRDDCPPWGPLESVIPMQVLARTLALALGNDVDKPRNLAKSVTVE